MGRPQVAAVEALNGFHRTAEHVIRAVLKKIAIPADIGKEVGLAQVLLDCIGNHAAGALHPVVEVVALQFVLVAAADDVGAIIRSGHLKAFDLQSERVRALGTFHATAQGFDMQLEIAPLRQLGVAAQQLGAAR